MVGFFLHVCVYPILSYHFATHLINPVTPFGGPKPQFGNHWSRLIQTALHSKRFYVQFSDVEGE